MEKPAYKRFLSYIYAYTGEVRMRNTGFAKVEVKNKQCKIGVNLQRITGQGTRPMEVFAFAGEQTTDTERIKYYLLPLGRIYLTGGGGELRCLMDEDAIAGSHFGLADLEGLLIKGNASTNRFLMTLWKEDRVDLEQLLKAKIPSQSEQTEGKKYKEKKLTEEKSQEQEVNVIQKVQEEPVEVKASKENIVLEQVEEVKHIEANSDMNENMNEDINRNRNNKEEQNQESQESVIAEDSEKDFNIKDFHTQDVDNVTVTEGIIEDEDIIEDKEALHDLLEEQEVKQILNVHKEQKPEVHEYKTQESEHHHVDAIKDNNNDCWQRLCRQFPQMQLPGCCQPLQVLRIGPADIGKLPKKNWAYGSNSFLLQGYCRQKHLILFCCKEEQKHCKEPHYYLGVPSTPTGRERMMASMFGFPYYLAAGQNGYWYTEIELRE